MPPHSIAQHDPVVRIEAAKLRRRLESYYLIAGQEDPIRIDIPKGTYVPTFEERVRPVPWTCPSPAGEPRRGGGAASGAWRRQTALVSAHDRPPRRSVSRGAGMAWRGPARSQIVVRRQPGRRDGAASGSQDRRVALPESERRSRAGLFRRRSHRPDRDGSRAIQGIVRPVDGIHREVPGTVGRSSTPQSGARRRLSAGRQRSTRKGQNQTIDPSGRCGIWQDHLVRDLWR